MKIACLLVVLLATLAASGCQGTAVNAPPPVSAPAVAATLSPTAVPAVAATQSSVSTPALALAPSPASASAVPTDPQASPREAPSPAGSASPRAEPRIDYRLIDRHALAAPPSALKSVASLAKYLVAPARSDRERARAIYRWITGNIEYDTAGFFSGHHGSGKAQDALRSRRSVCAGYASLFTQLCRAARLEVVEIGGHGRGFGYRAGDRYRNLSNHAWNAVKIDGQWRLVDSTWGAGYVDQRHTFVRRFSDFYFLTPPERFLLGHFPSDPKWQLVAKPLSKAEHEKLPVLGTEGLAAGVTFVTPTTCVLQTDGQTSVHLQAPARFVVQGVLEDARGHGAAGATFGQLEGDAWKVDVAPPSRGTWYLRLFGGTQRSGQYIGEVKVVARRGAAPLPEIYASFGGAHLEAPRTGCLAGKRPCKFELRVPGARYVAVIQGHQFTQLTRQGDRFTGTVTPVPGKLSIGANKGSSAQGRYQFLLGYRVQ